MDRLGFHSEKGLFRLNTSNSFLVVIPEFQKGFERDSRKIGREFCSSEEVGVRKLDYVGIGN